MGESQRRRGRGGGDRRDPPSEPSSRPGPAAPPLEPTAKPEPATSDSDRLRGGGGTRSRLLEQAVQLLARQGVGDQSLRQIAAGMGTSHRMLIYHFGSRAGLLAAVVDAMEQEERRTLERMTGDQTAPVDETARNFWRHVADIAPVHGPLYFELASHAMQHRPHTEPLRESNIAMWVDALSQLWRRAGAAEDEAAVSARLNLAVARGLLHDLLLTGDREAVDAAMGLFTKMMFPGASPTEAGRPRGPGRG